MARRHASYEEPFKENLQWQSGNEAIRSNDEFFVHLGGQSKHNRELSFKGEGAKERARLTAKMYERLKEHGIIHPKTRFVVYAHEDTVALAIVTPRLNAAPNRDQAKKIVEKLEGFRERHGLPELMLDLTHAFEKNYKSNFRSDGKNTYLIDPGLFTIAEVIGKPPTMEQLKRIAGKNKK